LGEGSARHKAATYTQNKGTQPMPRVGFETTTPVFERVKTVYALDHAATVIGSGVLLPRANQLEREADYSAVSTAEVKNA
jgi:hypothetical protein